MREDVFVYYVQFPDGVHSVCTPCVDGYNIYINDKLSSEEAQAAYIHEMVHINKGHLEKEIDVDQIEGEVHER